MPTLGQALDAAVRDADPPQLVRAGDRGRERDRLPIGRRRQVGSLARCDVAAHARAGHQVVTPREIASAARPSVRAVGGEEPDVIPRPGPRLVSMTEHRDRPAVRQPCGVLERGPASAAHSADRAGRHVHDMQVAASDDVGIPPAVRDESDPGPVGRPGRLGVGHQPFGRREPRRRASCDIDEPQLAHAVVHEALAVEHVFEPVDEPVVGLGRVAAARRARDPPSSIVLVARRLVRRADDDQACPIRRPLERLDTARQIGQPPRLAAIERQEMDLITILALGSRLGPGCSAALARPRRLLLDEEPTIRDERQRPTVRREPGLTIVPGPDGQLARSASVDRDQPDRVAVAVEAGRDGLQRQRNRPAVGRQLGLGGDAQAEEVVGTRRAGHGGPPGTAGLEVGTPEV